MGRGKGKWVVGCLCRCVLCRHVCLQINTIRSVLYGNAYVVLIKCHSYALYAAAATAAPTNAANCLNGLQKLNVWLHCMLCPLCMLAITFAIDMWVRKQGGVTARSSIDDKSYWTGIGITCKWLINSQTCFLLVCLSCY